MTTAPAVTAVLQDLVAEGTLTASQAVRVAERLAATTTDAPAAPVDPAPEPRDRGRLAEIAGYAGGALLLGAVALFLTSGWQDLSDTSRAVILAGTAVLLIVAGGLIALGGGSVRALGRRTTPPAAGSSRCSGRSPRPPPQARRASPSTTTSSSRPVPPALSWVVSAMPSCPAPSGSSAAWVACTGLVCGLIGEIGDYPSTTPYAVALVALGALWAGLAVTRVLREKEPGLALGAGLALFAAQLPVFASEVSGLGYALTAAVAVAGFAGYLSTRSWSVLGAGVLAMTLVVPEALHDWTDGSVSAAGSLLIAGLTLLAASAIGLRLRREVA